MEATDGTRVIRAEVYPARPVFSVVLFMPDVQERLQARPIMFDRSRLKPLLH